MKKVLSIALSVMLILSAFSVLMILPAVANDEIPDAPVNLIVNGDFEGIDTDGDGVKDKTKYTQEDQDASSYSGEFWKDAPVGWRAHTASGNVKTVYPSTLSPKGYLTNYDHIAATINQGQAMYQEIKIEAGKTYTVSATTGYRPSTTDSTAQKAWGIHMYLDAGKGLEATTRLTTEGDWCAINKMTFEIIDDTGYCGAGDFVTKSFTFAADDFIAANNLTAEEDGKYHARLVFHNYTWGGSYSGMVDNVSMYEIAGTVTAEAGGSVNTDVAYAGCKNTLVATPFYGNSFAGWYQGETLVSTNANYVGVVTDDIVAKFNVYNQIANGDFESDNTIDMHSNKSAYSSVIKEEANGNKYLQLNATTTGADLYAWQFLFTLQPNTKYVLSYDIRASLDAEGNPANADGIAFRTIMLKHNGNYAYTWSDPLFASTKLYTGGSALVYTQNSNIDLLPSSGTDLTPVTGSTSYLGNFTREDGVEWVHQSFIFDTSSMTLANGTTFTEATEYGFMFGANGAGTTTIDLDNLVISEVVEENIVHYESGDIGNAYINRTASTATLPVIYTAVENANGYKFTNWTDADGNVVSTANPYSTFDAAELTANFEFEKLDLGDNGGFEDNSMLAAQIVDLDKGASADFGPYTDADKALTGYEANMGDKFLKITANPDAGHVDVGFAVEVATGNKYLAHAKFRVLSLPETVNDEALATSSRFDARLGTIPTSWSDAPEGLTYKVTGRNGYGSVYNSFSTDGSLYCNWNEINDSYVDLYWVIDATALTADSTVYIQVGLRNGGEFALDNFSFINTADLAPTMEGAMIDVDGSTVHYVTSVDLPAYVSMNRVTTHMIAKYYIDNVYTDRAYDFDFQMKESGFASMRADEESNFVIQNADGDVMKNGRIYTTYEGFDAVTPTARVLARTDIELCDNYGNGLNIILGTNNTDADKAIDNGVYSRSLTQIKRLAAKAYIEGDADAAALAETMIDPVEGKALWNCNIDQVWAFVVAASELQ